MKKVYDILLIEDNEVVSSLITETLEKTQFRVKAVESTASGAVKAVSRVNPDLIIADIVIEGGINGIEAVERINRIHDCPVVYLTSHSDKQTIDRAKLTNPLGYIVKPFRPEELLYTINIAVKQFKENSGKPVIQFTTKKYMFSDKLNGLITTDRRGIVTSVNPVAEKLTGHLRNDSLGNELHTILNISEEPPENMGESLLEIIEAPEFNGIEGVYNLIDKSGKSKKIALCAYPDSKSWAKKESITILFDMLEKLSERTDIQKDIKLLLHTSNYIRYAIVSFLGNKNGIKVLKSSYPENTSFVENAKNDAPDVVIIDYGLYESVSNFIWDLTILNNELSGEAAIIVYFHYLDSELVFKALRAGAMGIIHSDSGINELLPAIRSVHKRKIWVDKKFIVNIAGNLDLEADIQKTSVENLTNREQQILNMVLQGHSNKKIAENLSISINTVKNILTSVYSKLEVRGRKDLFTIYSRIL